MRVTFSTKLLKSALAFLNPYLPARPSHPILTHLLFVPNGNDSFDITSFDLSHGATINVQCASIEEWATEAFTIHGKKFINFVSLLKDDTVTMVKEEAEIVLISGTVLAKFECSSSSEYAALPEIKGSSLTVPIDSFKDVLKRLSSFVYKGGDKPVLSGISVIGDNQGLTFFATDTHRLATARINENISIYNPDTSQSSKINIIINPHGLIQCIKLLKIPTEDITLTFNDSQIKLEIEIELLPGIMSQLVFFGRLLSGPFPNVSRLLNQKDALTFTCLKDEFLEAIKIGLLFVENKEMSLLTINNNTLEIAIQLSGTEPRMLSSIPVISSLEAFSIGFNPTYLKESIEAINGKEILFLVSNNTAPMFAKDLDDGLEFQSMIMPVSLA